MLEDKGERVTSEKQKSGEWITVHVKFTIMFILYYSIEIINNHRLLYV